jgi:uncharacterized protein (DUF362 family)
MPSSTNFNALPADNALVAVQCTSCDYSDTGAIRSAIDRCLHDLWLPDDFVQPGDRVVLKPNWVKEHDEQRPGPGSWEYVVTHPAVIEAVVRWVAPRLRGSGSITICDAPQTDSSFRAIREYCALDALVGRCRAEFPGLSIDVLDLRPEEWHAVDGVTIKKTTLPGDPLGDTHVRLDADSEFVGFHGQGKLYGASYDMAETNERHNGDRHEYMLCRTPMSADVFINLPKMKTHKKVGVTSALKNLVGINANKNWLPHHTEGAPEQGGDQFPAATTKARLEHTWVGRAKRIAKGNYILSRLLVPAKKLARLYLGDTQSVVRSGNWYGNDTCWRMVLDLNKCFFFFDGDGNPRQSPRRYLCLLDGIIAGEGNGPMAPDPKPCGVIAASTHPVALDMICATLMGFDWRKLRLLTGAFELRRRNFVPFRPEDIRVVSNVEAWRGGVDDMGDVFHFKPHFGWTGAIERRSSIACA